MVKITGVVFKPGGKTYYFAPGKERYAQDMGVIVETARGLEYATVVIPYAEVEEKKIITPLKSVVRIATQRDKEIVRKNREKKGEAMETAQRKIEERKLNMKLIDCEFTFDGSKVVFYYSSPARVDFRDLVKDLSTVFRMRIELRQIGIRDEIKRMGGIAPCGRECCCSSCMSDFRKVGIRMAKNQGLSLNPGKVSGLCGRLMCCLAYESDYYDDAVKKTPKVGSTVGTPEGQGVVINVNMLKMTARVRIDDKERDIYTYHDYDVKDLKFKRKHGDDGDDGDVSDELKEILD